ncbi:acetyltransferase [Defluviicoccus vanus]|uniref:Acetyltransferase n=1 Tax=Defluviicoccus vanus TaxID=111831 RepID=A0A7H1N338_9PROT|nr:acetyltransferase [Defluviicoccus vanus]QNT70124.1 acetyltransferase [Defluviicoccus vanus]
MNTGPQPSAEAAPLLIFPFNGNALEAVDCLGPAHRLVAFVDDTPSKRGPTEVGRPVVGREALVEHASAAVLAVPGSPASYRERRRIIEGLGVADNRFARVVHPTAAVSRLARVGCNVLIMAGVVVTSNAVIGDHVCILPNTVVHHDVVIGAFSLIGSNVAIAGGVQVGENCYVGSGSNIINGVELGSGCLIGLGSNVTRSVAAGTSVAGNPARPIKSGRHSLDVRNNLFLSERSSQLKQHPRE